MRKREGFFRYVVNENFVLICGGTRLLRNANESTSEMNKLLVKLLVK